MLLCDHLHMYTLTIVSSGICSGDTVLYVYSLYDLFTFFMFFLRVRRVSMPQQFLATSGAILLLCYV